MAHPDIAPSQSGAFNGDTGTYAKDTIGFLKTFSGEVINVYDRSTVTAGMTMAKTITSGKSSQFPVMGRAAGLAKYHTRGKYLGDQEINHNEIVININDPLIAHVYLAEIDELMNHYEVRGPYAQKLGEELAFTHDQHVLQMMIKGAQMTTPIIGDAGYPAGMILENSDAATDADAFVGELFKAKSEFTKKYVPQMGRRCYVTPDIVSLLANGSKIQNRDFGGEGSIATGMVGRIAGFDIVEVPDLPTTNVTVAAAPTKAGSEGRQAVDARNTLAVFAHPSSVGELRLMDLKTEVEWIIQNQVWILLAKYVRGYGVLRPEALGVLRSATPST